MRFFGTTGRRFSIFTKLVLAFLVVIAPLYALGAFVNDRGAKFVEQEISESLRQQAEFYSTSLETEFERMMALQREFMADEDLGSLSVLEERLSTYERVMAMRRLQARLSLIKESSLYISRARAYIPSIGRIISSNGGVNTLDRVRLEELKSDAILASLPFVHKDGELFIREYYPSPFNLDVRDPNFVLELQVSVPALYRFLEQLPGYENGGAVLVQERVAIVSEKHAASYDKIKDQVEAQLSLWAEQDAVVGGPSEARTATLTLQDEHYLTVRVYSPSIHSHMIVYVPEREVMGPLQKYRTYMWLISGIALSVVLVFAYWIYRVIHRPLRKMVGAFRKVEQGNLQVDIRHESNDEFRYMYEKFNFMVAHLNKLIYEVYEQKIHLQQSELKQLQSQINPHFLYNSFYLLYRMTKAHDVENATRFTRFLGDYYQYLTRNAKEEVRLEDEIRHVRAYTEIQSIRFADRIRVTLEDPPAEARAVPVPRLILQPIVENAYQHGFDLDLDDCRLQIGFALERSPGNEPLLSIVVRDNGAGMSDEQFEAWREAFRLDQPIREVTGMLNVHRRLKLKYGERAGVRLASGEPGLVVVITLPANLPPETGAPEGGA
ncbi:HAMP domain-containing protein [Paenibacillus antri]|uniref:HAMP domain-containing protein n=1 Tax=Paenibacillus antri TaxID=2582848 RepID=A0A5R9GGV0_9BACL|nr:histidine kinase [Paenibacillus antri]TLS53656.1 HAMP domain-containing protein [Paenibacillus antri]